MRRPSNLPHETKSKIIDISHTQLENQRGKKKKIRKNVNSTTISKRGKEQRINQRESKARHQGEKLRKEKKNKPASIAWVYLQPLLRSYPEISRNEFQISPLNSQPHTKVTDQHILKPAANEHHITSHPFQTSYPTSSIHLSNSQPPLSDNHSVSYH